MVLDLRKMKRQLEAAVGDVDKRSHSLELQCTPLEFSDCQVRSRPNLVYDENGDLLGISEFILNRWWNVHGVNDVMQTNAYT
jgi:hypothetical protein